MSFDQLPDIVARLEGFDGFVRSVMEDWKVPGLAVAIVKDDEVVFSQGFGLRSVAQNLPVTTRTLFPIASCTKAFTTAALSMLVDEGKLDWDTPVRTYMPRFTLCDPLASAHTTARDLATHRTGLPEHTLVWYNNAAITRQELLERLPHLEPTKGFRSLFQYNNLMYMAAGCLIEAITGQSWEEFVRQRIFEPLGMKRSNFDVVETARTSDDFSYPHQEVECETQEIPFYGAQTAIAPCGAIVSSVDELSNWVRLHLQKGTYQGQRLLSESQMRLLHTPQIVVSSNEEIAETPYSSYALGWAVSPYRGYPAIQHGGGIEGFHSLTLLLPNQHIGIALLSNNGGGNTPAILAYNAIERLLDLSETPWNERLLKAHQGVNHAERKDQHQRTAQPIHDAKPPQPLAAYSGNFENAGYGTVSMTVHEDGLRCTFNTMEFSLTHSRYEIFEMQGQILDMKVAFQTNMEGEIDTFVAPFEPTAKDIVFKRVPDKTMQETAFLETFVGEYTLPGSSLVVALNGPHTLSASLPGEPEYELVPSHNTTFHAKGASSIRFAFQLDATGVVVGAAVTGSHGVFDARKKA